MSTPLESPLQSPLLPSTSLTERDARFEGATPGAPDQKLEEESFAFLYDGIGNRLTAQKGNDTTAYTPNALNQYTDINGIEPVYDADGNLFSDGKNRYHWDAENHLTLVEPLVATEGSKRLEFKYDYIGRRVSKQVWTHTGGSWTDESTTAFVYDGWNLIEEVSTSSQTASINHYTWGLDLSGSLKGAGGVGGLLSVVCAPFTESGLIGDWLLPVGYVPLALSGVEGEAPSTFHYTFDLNGNVSELLDSTGSIAAHYEYGPFGEMLRETYPSSALSEVERSALSEVERSLLTFNFSTKYYDAELKTLYYGYRYYDPSYGRWLNRDPIEEQGGLNLYGFVGNDPVVKTDQFGFAEYVRGDNDPTPKNKYIRRNDWNSEPKTMEMVEWKTSISFGLVFARALYPDAARHLSHYFDNGGNDLEIRFSELISSMPSVERAMRRDVFLAMKFAEKLESGKSKITSSVTTTQLAKSSESKNWWFAVGDFESWGKAEVEVCSNNKIILMYNYKMYDPYDWHEEKGAVDLAIGDFNLGEVSDKDMRLFHVQGLAQEYEMVGSVYYSISWYRGDIQNAVMVPVFK